MCRNCWIRYGSPKISTPKIIDAAERIARVYHFYSTGGGLHIVIDDWNIDDDDIDWCLKKPLSSVERKCANAMRSLTVEERVSALALNCGFWE